MKMDYQKIMVSRSLISTGNNFRIKKAINKARQGEDVTIAYLGGSITRRNDEQKDRGFADASFRYFKERFATSGNLTYINAYLRCSF